LVAVAPLRAGPSCSLPGQPQRQRGVTIGRRSRVKLQRRLTGQICSLAATPSPASYFRESRVPAPIIADALNYNLRYTREVEDIGVLATLGDEDNSLGVPAGGELRAATGPAYGRIWDADLVDALAEL